jgi:nucleotide-binding universal stress UspA family protein
MFKHILVPTDGSPLAQRGVKTGIGFAKSLGARVTLLHVVPPYVPPYDTLGHLSVTAADHRKACARTAKAILSRAAAQARKAGVPCGTRSATDAQPWGAILRVAHAAKCDAIAMSSHGRGAVGGLFLGSETQRVLARARIPVLVTR